MPDPNQHGPSEGDDSQSRARQRSQLGALVVFLERLGIDESDLQALQLSQLGDDLERLQNQLIGLIAGELPDQASDSEISRAFSDGLKSLLRRSDDTALAQMTNDILGAGAYEKFLKDVSDRGREEALTSLSRVLAAAILSDPTNAFLAASLLVRMNHPSSHELSEAVDAIEGDVEKKRAKLDKIARAGWVEALQGAVQGIFGLIAAPVALVVSKEEKKEDKKVEELEYRFGQEPAKIIHYSAESDGPLLFITPESTEEAPPAPVEFLHLEREEDWRRRKREQSRDFLRLLMALHRSDEKGLPPPPEANPFGIAA